MNWRNGRNLGTAIAIAAWLAACGGGGGGGEEAQQNSAQPAALSLRDYVEIAVDTFVAAAVDTHAPVPTALMQVSEAPAGDDVFMFTHAYWDFSRQGVDQFRAGPQQLLRWDGSRFVDISAEVVGGIPAMYQAETTGFAADVNGDGRLDVVLGGNGWDGAGNVGEPSELLLSQAGTGFRRVTLPNGAVNPGAYPWVHGGTTLQLADRPGRAVFVGDIMHGPSYLVGLTPEGGLETLSSRLAPELGARTTHLPTHFFGADLPVTAALGVDLDGDGRDELVVGTMFSYSAQALAPALNETLTFVYRQDAAGSFATQAPLKLANGPFAKVDCWDHNLGGSRSDCHSGIVKQIASADFDRDGRPDLLITHHRYGLSAQRVFETGSKTQLLLNKGGLVFEDVTSAWFGSELIDLAGGQVHSHPFDLNNDGCVDVVLRGDANNGKQPRVFLSDCQGAMVEFTSHFLALIPQVDGGEQMHGGVPVRVAGRPAIALFAPGKTARTVSLHLVRFTRDIPTPANGQIRF